MSVDLLCGAIDERLNRDFEKCDLEEGMKRRALSLNTSSLTDEVRESVVNAFVDTMLRTESKKYTQPSAVAEDGYVCVSMYTDGK